MQISHTAVNRLVQNPPSAQPPQISDYDSWKPGRGRPRKDGRPNKSAVRLPTIINFPVPYVPVPPLPSPHLLVPKKMNLVSAKVNSGPLEHGKRFDEVVWTAEFRDMVANWDKCSAHRIAAKYGITPQCARRWASMVFFDYVARSKCRQASPLARQQEVPQSRQDVQQNDQQYDESDSYDDPFGIGLSVSLGHYRNDEDEDWDSDNSNPFNFSPAKERSPGLFPVSSEKSVAKPLHLEGDVLCLPDLHVPYFSSQRLHEAVSVAKQLGGCSQVILLGDSLDLNQISGFPGSPSKTSIQENLVTLGKIIKVLQKDFKVYAILGNHCARWMRACGGQIGLDWIIQSVFDGVHISEQHEFATLNCAGRKWVLAHGSGSNPLTFGQRTSAAAGGASVAFGHFHRPLASVTLDGDNQILAAGHMLDADKIAYYNQKVHFQKWVGTAGIIIRSDWGGRGKILTEECEEVRALAG